MNIKFYREISSDNADIQRQMLDKHSGAHRFFRASGPLMQTRFVELASPENIPKILIHGNPHIANYCKTSRGAAMVDFDRSRVGPYAYDIVRFLVSVSLCGPDDDNDFLHPVVIDHFRRGYLYGLFANKRYEHEEMHELRTQEPRRWQMNPVDYLESKKKWAKKLFENTVDLSKKRQKMFDSYLESINGELDMNDYSITTCSEVPGSMGKMHYLYLLEGLTESLEPVIIDIKEVYSEPDNEWFSNPFEHHGIRMNKAGEVYAPGWEQMPGHATHKGEQFWCRKIPIQQVKLAAPIEKIDQCDLCFSVAAELGRGHSKASQKYNAKSIYSDFSERFDMYIDVSKKIQLELLSAHEVYCAQMVLSKYAMQ